MKLERFGTPVTPLGVIEIQSQFAAFVHRKRLEWGMQLQADRIIEL